jgi:hypothetical protein
MGIDGQNLLHIRGPKEVLDALEASGCVLPSKDDTITFLNDNYFGEKFCKVRRHSDKYMTVSYAYRNNVFHEYLLTLLELYPQCWLKNEFSNEDGYAGVWIARMVNGKPQVQECEWTELTVEELCHLDDFSVKE